ncbi:DUF2247 family protein [Wohlfahrtiimonas populi]|uniref:DUF2247 family protein n=1 Tax=Wohlfahrtiimonas populi TaxID=1940240 RepID=UPI00098D4172|nr:DUF2247 family protein [Wohlfahrtiimonas populi]
MKNIIFDQSLITPKINITYDFMVNALDTISWKELLWGIKNHIINSDVINAIAYDKYCLDDENDQILLLTYQNEDDYSFLHNLCLLSSKEDTDIDYNKLLYLILFWLYSNQEKYNDPMKIIELIYANFDYPESLKSFIGYESYDGKCFGRQYMYDNWFRYINENKLKYKSINR